MHATRLTAFCGLVAVALGVLAEPLPAAEQEHNVWPITVSDHDSATAQERWSGAGPFLFDHPKPDGGRVSGFRPFWMQESGANGAFQAGYFLYPLFTYRVDENTYQWNFFELIRRTDRRKSAPAALSPYEPKGDFEIWPFWFSRQTGDPELSYRGLFPVLGDVKNKLSFDEAKWVLFPLYLQTRKRDVETTSIPWPFVRFTHGAAHGFGIWPLFEVKERPGVWKQQYYLWPLGYNNTTYPSPDAAPGTPPTRDIGVLPLYARRTAAGYIDESYLWPFFGYTNRTSPVRYHETRYLWPFLVQGRGDDHYVNRWGPVYTHSVVKGYDKTWLAWPLVRHAEWTDRGLAISKTQLLYFLYWSEQERSLKRPNAAPASMTHVWPLFSAWNNGAGRKQFQLFSPLEVFFPGNEKIRNAWSPFFAIARTDQTASGEKRTSLLWHAITWQRDDAAHRREFHLGPIFSISSEAERRRVAIGNGLLAFRRDSNTHWKVLWLDFPSHSATTMNQRR